MPPDEPGPDTAEVAMTAMSARAATALVLVTSAAVLVLEILAGRLMAPYIGVSLDTFTGIIGIVLAGIAVGAWGGGSIADRRDPTSLIGPCIVAGGALSWLSVPIVDALGPELGSGPPAIVVLTTAAFFAPAAALTAVSPMVAKLRLASLRDTGAVVGGLSAAGTLGALAGTFLTGFVLVAAAPSRSLVAGLGLGLVVLGMGVHWWLRRHVLPVAALVAVVLAGVAGLASTGPCGHETRYFCVRIESSPDDPSLRSLYLDDLRHAAVDLDDPTRLDIRYIRLFADVARTIDGGPLDTLHIGGGGFSFPRYLQHVRPGSTDLVLEIDAELVDIAERDLGLVRSPTLEVRSSDARLVVDELADDGYDLVIGDAFAGSSVPWHLTTREFVAEIDRVLRPDGIYAMNVIDGADSRYARAQLATLAETFDHVGVILPADGVPEARAVNQVLLASDAPLPMADIAADDGVQLSSSETSAFVGDAEPLRDDFAPVDQLLWR